MKYEDLCLDIIELIENHYKIIQTTKQNKKLFDDVIKCIYIQEDDYGWLNEEQHQEFCISWMLEMRRCNVMGYWLD